MSLDDLLPSGSDGEVESGPLPKGRQRGTSREDYLRMIAMARTGATPKAIALLHSGAYIDDVLPVLADLEDKDAAVAYRAIIRHIQSGCKWSA